MNASRIRDAMRCCRLPDVLDHHIAELRLGLAVIALDLLEIEAGFRRDLPRGCDRRCGGSGSLVVARTAPTAPAVAAARQERFARRRAEGPDAGSPDRRQTDATIDVSREVVQTWDPG